jgi:uncharacterized OB-fold protein
VTDVLVPQPVGIPLPRPSMRSAPYWAATARQELVYQRCDTCSTIARKPTSVCGVCLGSALSWVPSSGRGTLYSWTVVWRPQHPSFVIPYAPCVAEMEEGWFLLSSVIGCPPEELAEGMALQVEFHPAGGEIWLPYVRPRTD